MEKDNKSLDDEFLDLLGELQHLLCAVINSTDITELPPEMRYLFISASTVSQAAGGFYILRRGGQIYASKFLIRPIVEAAISATAALKQKGFLFRKTYTELLEEKKAHPPGLATDSEFTKQVDILEAFFKNRDSAYPAERKKVNTREAAEAAGLTNIYEVVYRLYCKYTHGGIDAALGAFNKMTDDLDTYFAAVFVLQILEQIKHYAGVNMPDLSGYRASLNSLLPSTLRFSPNKMSLEIDNLGAAIVKGIFNPEAKDLAVDLADFEVAEILDEAILKEIPVIKSIIACHKTWEAVHDKLFLKKVARFLLSCPQFTPEQKEQFINGNLKNTKAAKHLSELIVLILDKLDDFDKPQMVAKAFASFVRKEINFETFRRLAAAIDMGLIYDLHEFAKLSDTSDTVSTSMAASKSNNLFNIYMNLVRTGLVGQKRGSGITPITGVRFEITELGKVFIKSMNT